jgi:hypothetical protein
VARCAALAAVLACALAGCAVRQDASGVSRVGVLLWGFGDPPGVNWNLDWPRAETVDLPPRREPPHLDLPPRREPPRLDLPPRRESEPHAEAIDDNRIRETRITPNSRGNPVALRGVDPGPAGARG